MAEALKHSNCKLNSLTLAQNNVTDKGAECLAEALKHSNCKLNTLDFSFNNVTDNQPLAKQFNRKRSRVFGRSFKAQ